MFYDGELRAFGFSDIGLDYRINLQLSSLALKKIEMDIFYLIDFITFTELMIHRLMAD